MKKVFLPLLLLLMAFSFPGKKKITIWLCGDSTMSIKETKAFPETGWGMPFIYFWDTTVTVENLAKNGRSTSSFRNEGLWQKVLDKAEEGDYVFIQFGHNDEVATKKTYTTEAEFKTNLEKYVDDTKSKKANPVLLTPVARRKFDSEGKVVGTHDVYAKIVRDVAKEKNVSLIDLDKKGQELIQSFGKENSKFLFNQLKPGEHPNYPEGKEDNTHFNELGARLIAEIVLKEIQSQHLDLENRIINHK
ncbi:MAG: rhamnogalacturonan acetylesterase [Bacteroidota bacterium]